MQHFMEHGNPQQKTIVLNALHASLDEAALHIHAVTVLDAALRFAALPDARELARHLLRVEQLLPRLAQGAGRRTPRAGRGRAPATHPGRPTKEPDGQRRGQAAVESLLHIVDDQLFTSVALQLQDMQDSPSNSAGGRSILKALAQRPPVQMTLDSVLTAPLRKQ